MFHCTGLEGGFTEEKQVFTVDVKGAGQGGLALAIDGPAETQINCKDNRDGTCEVEYQPVRPGDYDVTIKFADQHIPGKTEAQICDLFVDDFTMNPLTNATKTVF